MQKFLTKVFKTFQKLKINILPNHYYSNIPDFRSLNSEDYWKKPMSMVGVQGTDITAQLEFAKSCVAAVGDQTVLQNQNIHKKAIEEQTESGYGIVEADLLYAFICKNKPKKVIQIGCGVSTMIILRACRDIGHKTKLVCVEPYPSEILKSLHSKGEIELIADKAQVVDVNQLADLESGDLFFMDSTHTVKVGSEVNRMILEILPRLKTGVFVHFHDIYFPYDYQRNVNETIFFWSESTLLHSFLVNNSKYTIRASQSMLHYNAKEELKSIFPNYNPQSEIEGLPTNRGEGLHFPSAIYLEVI